MTEQHKKPHIRIHYDVDEEVSGCAWKCVGNVCDNFCARDKQCDNRVVCLNRCGLPTWFELVSGDVEQLFKKEK